MRQFNFLCALVWLSGCGGGDADPCAGITGTCIEIAPGPDNHEAAQTALIEAQPGDAVVFLAGLHEFDRDLSLDVDGVIVRGEGMDETVLSFAGQTEGAQGFLVTADEFTIEDLAIEDTVGDGLKLEGTTGVYIRRVRVEWTGGPSSDNGAYGLYPVQCKNVLIEDSVVRGASDAGIYVGQSENIIVRRNQAERNVAGIEIENSIAADVYDNVATNNTGGLLIFNLPGLQLTNGARVRAYRNKIVANNTDNFAAAGNIVAAIPRGTGIVLLAAREVELFENQIEDHDTISLGIISYLALVLPFDDPEYDPYSNTIYAHDNTFGKSGESYDPDDLLTELVGQALRTLPDWDQTIPSIVFFGYIDPAKAAPDDARRLQDPYNLCFQNNAGADFANLDIPNAAAMVSADLAPHDCQLPALSAVAIPGVESE